MSPRPASQFLSGTTGHRRTKRVGPAPSQVLQVELLEDRLAPAAGTLDGTFGVGGRAYTDIVGSTDNFGEGVALQTDGKVLVAGYSNLGPVAGSSDFALVRYNANGTLDAGFGNNGRVITNLGPQNDRGNDIAVQSDGKIIVVGSSYQLNTDIDFALVRYNSDGSPDASFGTNGIVVTNIGVGTTTNSRDDHAWAVVVQPDGKIVVTGQTMQNGSMQFGLARYNPDGTLDATFGGDGIVTNAVGNEDYPADMALQDDGKIVVVGQSKQAGTGFDFSVVRYNSDGSLDSTFDGDGKAMTSIGQFTDSATSVAILPSGAIVVAGLSQQPASNLAIARYNSDGSLDATFDADGKFLGTTVPTAAMALTGDGKFVFAGGAAAGIAVARLNSDGTFDTTFDTDGKAGTVFGQSDSATSVVVRPDGKVVAVGRSFQGEVTGTDFAVAQFRSNGSLDTTFNTTGRVTTDLPGSNANVAADVAVQADGKVVVVGYTEKASARNDFALARYDANGALDTTFGTGGTVVTDFSFGYDRATAVAIQADGKIVVVGSTADASGFYDVAVARYNANGSLDTTFDGDGKVITNIQGNNDSASAVVIQPDGKIVVGGSYRLTSSNSFALLRYNSNGTLDTSFDLDGKAQVPFLNGSAFVTALALLPDGKIVAAGGITQTSPGHFAVARFNANGTLDLTFDTDGKLVINTGNYVAMDLAVQPDGKMLVAGANSFGGIAVARVTSTGVLDNSFDGDGNLVAGSFSAIEELSLEVLDDGRVVVAAGDAVAQFNSNGSVDSTFGTQGRLQLVDFQGKVLGSALQDDGNLVFAGYRFNTGTLKDLAAWRVTGITPEADGVPGIIENSAPNGGDGNQDGTLDSQQDNVTSLPNFADARYVTLESPGGTNLADVEAVANPSPADAPEGVTFPIGFLDFSIQGVAASAATTMTLYLPTGVTANTYYKFGRTPENTTPHWYQFLYDGTTGAQFNPAANTITLHFVDGGRGDDDLEENGVIVDPGSAGLKFNQPPVAEGDDVLASEDAADVTIHVLANDDDDDQNINHSMTIALSSPALGILVNNHDGTFTYQPNGEFEHLAQGETAIETFSYQISDSFGEVSTATVTITITGQNDKPSITVDNSSVTIAEGTTATNGGTFSDVDLSDEVTITASKELVCKSGTNSGSWSWSFDGVDDLTDVVCITATDGEGGVATLVFCLTVNNVAPVATVSNNGPVTYGNTFTVSLSNPMDPSIPDTTAVFHYAFNLTGDFTGMTYANQLSTPSQTFSQNAGTYTVYARIIDKDNGYTQYCTTVTVNKAPSATTTLGAGPFVYDGTTHTGGSGTVTGAGGLTTGATSLSYSGDQVNAGTYYVTAHYAGDANHEPSVGEPVAITINKAPSETTTLGAGPFVYDGTAYTGGSGTVSGAGGLTTGATSLSYSGDQVNAGTYYVTAHYAGDANHEASEGEPVAITINKASSTTTATGGTFTYDATAHAGSGSVSVIGGSVTISYVGINGTTYSSATPPTAAGSYTVIATYAGDDNHAGSNGTAALTIQAKLLEASAWSQGTINIGSNGVIALHLAVSSGQLYGTDTVASLFDGAIFTIKVQKADGSYTYGTLTSAAKVETDGSITVTMQMNDSLRAELYDAYMNGRAVSFTMTATANGGNYLIDEDTMSKLLNNGALKYVV